MRTFELTESSRFWAIQRRGTTITVRYGKVGGKATSRTTQVEQLGECLKSYQRQIVAKLNDGYIETTEAEPPLDAVGQALEAALVEEPDDLAAHMALADYLSEQHDARHQARGEFIRLQLQLEDAGVPAGQRKKLAKREQELLDANRARWLGWELHDLLFDGGAGQTQSNVAEVGTLGYRRGWADRLQLPLLNAVLARSIARAPALRLLRELVIDNGDYSEDELKELSQFEHLGNLRKLRIDDVAHSESLDAFIARLPRLEELHIEALEQDLGRLFRLPLPNLRKLHVAEAREFDIKALAKNKTLKNLTHLSLYPDWTQTSHGPHITAADFHALVASKHLTALTHLTVRRTNAGDSGIEALIRSGLLGRLVELDLALGCVTDVGAYLLASSPHFGRLRSLSLSTNRLTADGIAVLRREGLTLNVEDQQGADGGGAYDDEYLYEDIDYDFDEDDDLDEWE